MRWLIDANVPKGIPELQGENFQYVYAWGDFITDEYIWNYALENQCIIVTRDADFMLRFFQSVASPRVVYLQLQEMTRKNLKEFLRINWPGIETSVLENHFVVVSLTGIQAFKKSEI